MDTDRITDTAAPATEPDPWVPDETGVSPGARRLAARVLASPMPESCVDENGRLKPMTEEELKRRAKALEETLKAIEQITDESDEIDWEEAERDLDSFRPHRPLFRRSS